MTAVRLAGDEALLVEVGEGAREGPARLAAAIAAERIDGVTDIIPGARTVLVVTDPGRCDLAALGRKLGLLRRACGSLPASVAEEAQGGVREIPVLYEGQDLADVAELVKLTTGEVISRHCAAEYTVGWLGFSPGFPYLTGLDPLLHVPRLAAPRISVAAGSVAIAGPLATVYPSASPGGWRLLGRTSARLWDASREPPAVLPPGARVRFRPVDKLPPVPADLTRPSSRECLDPGGHPVIEVLRPGPLATVQDLGRPGYGHLGVPRSGAADPASLRLANRLVGNPDDAAGIEFTFGGAELHFHEGVWGALTGAVAEVRMTTRGPGCAVDVRPGMPPARRDNSGFGAPFYLPAGSLLTVPAPTSGLRSYLALRGGVAVPPVLGSRSADLRSRLGGAPLRAGDLLPVGTAARSRIVADLAPLPAARSGPAELRVIPGPRDDWFPPETLRALTCSEYEVTTASDRTGMRLAGVALLHARREELPSEGMVIGALQVTPGGMPILFLADHPVTGGYPVIAVVVSADIGLAAQLRPGDRLRFRLSAGARAMPARQQQAGRDR